LILVGAPAAALAQEEANPASACGAASSAFAAPAPLPHVAHALRTSKRLRILVIGAPVDVGRAASKSYPVMLEGLLERALAGIDVQIDNRPVSGEIAADAIERIRTEIALSRPDLLIWQVGANDVLAHVPPEEYESVLDDGVRWVKDNGVDVLLVGFAVNRWLQDDPEARAIRAATLRVAKAENAPYLRRSQAKQLAARAQSRVEQGGEPFSAEMGYDCLAEQVAHALAANLVLRRVRPAAPGPK
jgi:acyl-CoA thioesterase-1